MKVKVNGVVTKTISVKAPAPHSSQRALSFEEASAPITPQDVHNVVEIIFTIKEAVQILIAAFKSWFKKK